MRISEPLLATSKTVDPSNAKQMAVVLSHLPLLASFKLDGIRCVGQDGHLLSRTMKLIPNVHTQKLFSPYQGLDGELIVGDPTDPLCYNKTVSAVMRQTGEPEVRWFVFDAPGLNGFNERLRSIAFDKAKDHRVIRLEQKLCHTWAEIIAYEKQAIDLGYEGLILRRPDGRYKEGRATLNEGIALKFKRFVDSEAVVLDMTELQHNLNEQTINETGRLKRSSHQAGKMGGGTMGNIVVRDIHSGVEFEIGTGFTAEERQEWWNKGSKMHGTIVKYKSFMVGVKDKPRHPVFLGLRHKDDL